MAAVLLAQSRLAFTNPMGRLNSARILTGTGRRNGNVHDTGVRCAEARAAGGDIAWLFLIPALAFRKFLAQLLHIVSERATIRELRDSVYTAALDRIDRGRRAYRHFPPAELLARDAADRSVTRDLVPPSFRDADYGAIGRISKS
jgi:hypothetical protein